MEGEVGGGEGGRPRRVFRPRVNIDNDLTEESVSSSSAMVPAKALDRRTSSHLVG